MCFAMMIYFLSSVFLISQWEVYIVLYKLVNLKMEIAPVEILEQ